MQSVIPRNNFSADTNRNPSPNLWTSVPQLEIIQGKKNGLLFFDDFENFSQHITDQDVQKYASYIDSSATIKQLAGVVGGVAEMANNGTDNDETVLATHGPMVQLSTTASTAFRTVFECRWKKASVANNAHAAFIGLAFDHGNGVPLSKTLCLTDDDGALGAFSFLGFHVDHADGDALDFVYKAAGQSAVVLIAGVQALAADTYYKLGFDFDPRAGVDYRIKVCVDNEFSTTYGTHTQMSAATFPDDEPLGLCWAGKVGAGAASKAQLDWWKLCQIME